MYFQQVVSISLEGVTLSPVGTNSCLTDDFNHIIQPSNQFKTLLVARDSFVELNVLQSRCKALDS